MNKIKLAKEWVEKEYPSHGRKWIKKIIKSYNNRVNNVEIYVYEGSPAKGVIIASYDYKNPFYVLGVNCWGKVKKF